MTRILVINPNTSPAVSDVIRHGLAAMAMEDVEITVINAPFGAESIETPAEACIAAHALLAALADHQNDADAYVIGAFGDPGLEAAVSVMTVPVVGTAAAAFAEAGADDRRFAVITLGRSMENSIRAAVTRLGYGTQLTGIHFLDASVLDFTAERDLFEETICAQGARCVTNGAEAIVLGGAPFTGMGAALTTALQIPVLAGLEPAIRLARTRAIQPPPLATHYSDSAKRFVGLPDNIIALLNGASSHTEKS
ncbi:MAG TPA: aspartate/glutamate racemase family protein [Magnetospirillaceae bacterium]|jgi:Asp/Glu/hydantoin racemase